MRVTRQRALIWLLALSPSLTSCATWQSMVGGGSADAPAVMVTAPPADAPANVVLAATSAQPAAPSTPRPALAGDACRDALADAYRSTQIATIQGNLAF